MSAFPNFKDVSNLSSIDFINDELFLLHKFLFELKVKSFAKVQKNDEVKKIGGLVFGSQKKSHYFTFLKRRIAQLNYRKSILLKQQYIN